MSVIKSDYACKCNLPYNSEGLDGKNDKDWSIPRLDNQEGAHLADPSDSGLGIGDIYCLIYVYLI